MSIEDRERWNRRYQLGAYEDRTYPSEILIDWIDLLPKGRALEIACGSGKNARFLANNGFETVGLDISDVALQRARERENPHENKVEYLLHDLDEGLPHLGLFNVITMIRFLDLKIISTLDQHLVEGGCAVFELHMKYEHSAPLAGPRTQRFRDQSGEIEEASLSHGSS